MRFATTLAVALVLVSLAVVPATAATITLVATQSAFGHNASGADMNFPRNNVYGDMMLTGPWLNAGTTNAKKTWLKFDLSTIVGTATSATLELTKVSSTAGADPVLVAALLDGDAGEGWGETTLTWNNAPGNVDDIGFNYTTLPTPGNMTYLGAFWDAIAEGPGTLISYSDGLLDVVNNDTDDSLTLAFAKRGYYLGGFSFASLSNTTYGVPTLVLTGVTFVPEPSTFTLLGIGLAGLLACAWRKRE